MPGEGGVVVVEMGELKVGMMICHGLRLFELDY